MHCRLSRISALSVRTGVLWCSSHRVCTRTMHDEHIAASVDTARSSPSSPLSTLQQQQNVYNANLSQWTCTCGFKNHPFRECCFSCKAARVDGSSGTSNSTDSGDCANKIGAVFMPGSVSFDENLIDGVRLSSQPILRHDSLANQSGRTTSVGQRRLSRMDIKSFRHGDWMCGCGEHNFAKRETCRQCGTPRLIDWAATHRKLAPNRDSNRGSPHDTTRLYDDGTAAAGHWTCLACHSLHTSHQGTTCTICGTPRHLPASQYGQASDSASRSDVPVDCVEGVHMNRAVAGDAQSPANDAAPDSRTNSTSSVGFTRKYDDWNCPKCRYLNFSSRVTCKQCRTMRTQTFIFTDSMLSKDGGVPGGAMWTCECGYRNYVSRNVCRECGANCPAPSMN